MTKLNIDIKDHRFRELLTYWRKVIAKRLRRGQYYEDPRYGMLVLTRREFLKLLVSLGIAGAIASLGIGMFNAHWVWAQETTNPPPTPAQYNYGELNWLELTVRGTPLGEGLVAEYLFWEGTGTILHDTSGNNYYLTPTATSGWLEPEWRQLTNGKWYLYFGPDLPTASGATKGGFKASMGFTPFQTSKRLTIEVLYKLIEMYPTSVPDYWRGIVSLGSNLAFICVNVISRDFQVWVNTVDSTGNRTSINFYSKRDLGKGLPENTWVHVIVRICVEYPGRLRVWTNLWGEWDSGNRTDVANWFQTYVANALWVASYNQGLNWLGKYAKHGLTLVRLWSREVTNTERDLLHKLAKIMVPELL